MKIEITGKTIAAIVAAVAGVVTIALTTTLLCDNMDAKASKRFESNLTKYYPAVHAPCEKKVKKLGGRVKKVEIGMIEVRAYFKAMSNEEQKNVARHYFKEDTVGQSADEDDDQ